MKILLLILFFVNLLFSNQMTLKIAINKDMIPYSYIDETNRPNGLFVEYWQLWAKKSNQKIEFIPFSRSESLKALKEKEIDIHSGLLGYDKSKKDINYIKQTFNSKSYIYINKKNKNKIQSIKDLNNRTIGLISDSYFNSYIKKKFPKINIKPFKQSKDLIRALHHEEIDSFIDDSLVTWIESIREFNFINTFKLPNFELDNWFYASTAKQNKELTAILLEGMSKISNEEIISLEEKWIIDEELRYFSKKEKAQVFSNKKEQSKETDNLFTREELNYIKNSPILIIGVDDWAPVYFLDNYDKLNGISAEFFTLISNVSGLKFKESEGTWDENLNNFKNRKIDILPAVFYTKQREKYGEFSNSYFDIRTSLFVKSKNNDIKSFPDLIGKKLAILKSDARVNKVKKIHRDIKIIETSGIKESIFMLLNNEVDAILESDIIVQHLLKKEMISGVKLVFQNTIKSNSIHIFSKKDDIVLQSILQKSLHSITNTNRDEIIKKWLNLYIKKDASIAFGVGREPYTLNKRYLKGIEYDLIKKILHQSDLTIKNTNNLPQNDLEYLLKYNNKFDMVVSVKEKKDGFYYSNNFINSQNVAISRIEDNIHIDSIQDLANKEIMAFNRAYKYLGDEYNKLFNPQNEPITYMEVGLQEYQVRDFLEKKAEVIIIDINIFKWYLKKFTNESINNYKIHSIFSDKDSYKVAFRDKNMRDIFNINLKKIKDSGEYEEIFNNYIQYDIEAKVKINSLIASIISKYIFSDEVMKLDEIVESFSQIEYINKIEIFDNENNLLSTNTNKEFKLSTIQDSFYLIDANPQKVGYIKVYFDEDKLNQFVNNSQLIPNLEIFQKLSSYSYIKDTYKRFDYYPKKLIFTKKEKNFIKNNPILTFSQINWQPLSIITKNEFSGVFADYLKIIEKKTGIEFKYSKANTWKEVLNKFEKNETDLMVGVSNNAKSLNLGLISNEFTNFNYSIVTTKDAPFINGLKDLEKKIIVIPKGYSSNTMIKIKYPNIQILETKDINEALTFVSQGKAYAFVGHIAVSVFNIKNHFPELKIAGVTEERFNHHFLVQNSQQELLSILNKVLSSISNKQKQNIKDKWIKTKVTTAVDYSLVLKIVIIFTFIILIVLIFAKKLAIAKRQIEISNKKLNKNLDTLVKTQAQLVESKKMASLGGLVAGVAHEINTPVGTGLTGITYFSEITEEIKKEYESDNMSQEDFERYLKTSSELASSIYKNLYRTANLVKSFKQIAIDQTSEEKIEFNFKKNINDILLSINNIIKKTKIVIKIECDNDLTINSYPGCFSQIFTNLIINSVRHAYRRDEQGNILIEVVKKNDILTIVYKDDGQGIEEKNIDKIFEPFFTTNREEGSTGLGLNVVYNIVSNNLKGIITCKSKVGEGAQFMLKFNT